MARTGRHLVRRCVLDASLHGTEAEGLAVQQGLTRLARDWLAPALDRGLAEAAGGGEDLWTIDRLTVELPPLPLDRLERDFAQVLEAALARRMGDFAPPPGADGALPGQADRRDPDREDGLPQARRRTSAAALLDAFTAFLESGALPWWFRLPEGRTFEEVLLAGWPDAMPPEGYRHFVIAAAARPVAPVALIRLVRQFSPHLLETLLDSLRPGSAAPVRTLLGRIEASTRSATARRTAVEGLWLAAFHDAATASPPETGAMARRTQAWEKPAADRKAPGTPGGERAVSPDHSALPATLDLDEGVHVDCAGLVLLHPFLPQLFGALGVARNGRLVDTDRALGLLHYLATGQPAAPEHALILPKRLCDLPLEAPCGPPVPLEEADRAEADGMLRAVIAHWEALGSISIDTLRGSFLTRLGRLSRRGDEELLQVESQAFDILLDRLPWGLSAVRLPWMTDILWVEWTH